MDNPLADILRPPRPVAAVLAADADAAWAQLRAWGDELPDGGRLVACRWSAVPPLAALIDAVVGALADVALADWPHWYGTTLADEAGGARGSGDGNTAEIRGGGRLAGGVADGGAFERDLDVLNRVRQTAKTAARVDVGWLRWAAARCLAGRRPADAGRSPERQADQLARAVAAGPLVIGLCAGPAAGADSSTAAAADGDAAAMAAAGEWLHRVTGAAVVLVVPAEWRDDPALRRLNPTSAGPTAEPPTAGGDGGAVPGGPTPPAGPTAPVAVSATPLPGRPHPGSPAERVVYDRVRADPELGPLLAFNRTVPADLGRTYRVDLLCAARRVVVEIDGDDHAVAFKYAADCERDYRLLTRGYVVLRLPNRLVLGDPAVAVERIRDVLRARANVVAEPTRTTA